VVVEPGTPPVTLIESLSSAGCAGDAGAGCAASAGAGFDASGRIELPTVPSFMAGTEDDGDAIGALIPS
jgi:hypothetical protein